MTIDEAIQYAKDLGTEEENKIDYDKDSPHTIIRKKNTVKDYRQLAEWLRELTEAKAMLLDTSYTLEVMCDKVSTKIGCERCTYYDEEIHGCEVRKWIDKMRTFCKRRRVRALTLDEAIARLNDKHNHTLVFNPKQLAGLLTELKELKEENKALINECDRLREELNKLKE